MTRQQLLSVAKPILFNTDMARAILDGRKTVTMRVCKFVMKPGQNQNFSGYSVGEYCTGNISSGAVLYSRRGDMGWTQVSERTKPKYLPGNILYVRETWTESGGEYFYRANNPKHCNGSECSVLNGCENAVYCERVDGFFKWRPSIHMPKEAARIFLKVTDVRVERLQDIGALDAKNEGVRVHANGCIDGLAFGCYNGDRCVKNECEQPILYFQELWDSTIKKSDIEKYGWEANPWVWVYEFERVIPK